MKSSYKPRIIKLNQPARRIANVRWTTMEADRVEDTWQGNLAPSQQEEVPTVQLTREELEARLQQAYQEGFQEGVQQCESKLKEELEESAQRLIRAVDTLAEEKGRFFQEAETKLFNLLLLMVEKIVGSIQEVRPVIQHTLEKLLAEEQFQGEVKIYLNPADLSAVERFPDRLKQIHPDVNSVHLIAQESVAPGGCLIETDLGRLDARIDTQLQELIRQVKTIYQKL